MANALANETSPYLLQHKHNPVDWRPWSPDAFAEARRRDVPVFLSVGYSTCYWCHVMEREVFENHDLATRLNNACVPVKVDREERPDIDEHYMTVTQIMTGQGGWPMSVFLTPEGGPFFAGTYFPPDDHPQRPGFGTLLDALSAYWHESRDDLLRVVANVHDALHKLAAPRPPADDTTLDETRLRIAVDDAARDYDPRHGGFGRGGGPKFPRQTLLALLLEAGRHEHALRHTLHAMADGGIRDHLAGAFHRYSTDVRWLVPHFEVMLYDQAMLATAYADASRRLDEPRFALVARGICDSVLSRMTHPDGPFYTALDAEVDAREGMPYLWTPDETREVLQDSAPFDAAYGLDRGFNFADPHGPNPHTPHANVLHLVQRDAEHDPAVVDMRRRLLAARDRRKQPLLDTKILTSWNGLMVEALARVGEVLDEPRYLHAAHDAARWLLTHHLEEGHDVRLLRSSRDEKHGPAGVLDDYAHLGLGLLALGRRDDASRLTDVLLTHFAADDTPETLTFGQTARDSPDATLMGGVRRRTAGDSPLPAGNASAALLLLGLGRVRDARRVVSAFAAHISDNAPDAATMTLAALRLARAGHAVSAAGRTSDAEVSPGSTPDPLAEAGRVVALSGEWVDTRRLDVLFDIVPGFHLHPPPPTHPAAEPEAAGKVAGGSAGVEPLTVTASDPDAVALIALATPADADGFLTGRVRVEVHLIEPLKEGDALELSAVYQACDAFRCLPTVRKTFAVRLSPDGT